MFIRQLLEQLQAAQLQYCIVGGLAVNLHGVPRMTYDVDLVVLQTTDQLTRLAQLLERIGLRCRLPVQLADFSDPSYRKDMLERRSLMAVTFTDPSNPIREVDIVLSPLIDAADLIDRAIKLDLDGICVPVASLPDLIALKRASRRDQDADDADLLERILREDLDE